MAGRRAGRCRDWQRRCVGGEISAGCRRSSHLPRARQRVGRRARTLAESRSTSISFPSLLGDTEVRQKLIFISFNPDFSRNRNRGQSSLLAQVWIKTWRYRGSCEFNTRELFTSKE